MELVFLELRYAKALLLKIFCFYWFPLFVIILLYLLLEGVTFVLFDILPRLGGAP